MKTSKQYYFKFYTKLADDELNGKISLETIESMLGNDYYY